MAPAWLTSIDQARKQERGVWFPVCMVSLGPVKLLGSSHEDRYKNNHHQFIIRFIMCNFNVQGHWSQISALHKLVADEIHPVVLP